MSSDSDIRMLVKVERSPYSNSWGGNIFYVIGKPVKMQYESHLNEHMPYGGFDPYAGDPYYEGLQVSSQGDLDTGNVYGHAVEYHDLTRLGLLDAERFVKVLRTIHLLGRPRQDRREHQPVRRLRLRGRLAGAIGRTPTRRPGPRGPDRCARQSSTTKEDRW